MPVITSLHPTRSKPPTCPGNLLSAFLWWQPSHTTEKAHHYRYNNIIYIDEFDQPWRHCKHNQYCSIPAMITLCFYAYTHANVELWSKVLNSIYFSNLCSMYYNIQWSWRIFKILLNALQRTGTQQINYYRDWNLTTIFRPISEFRTNLTTRFQWGTNGSLYYYSSF